MTQSNGSPYGDHLLNTCSTERKTQLKREKLIFMGTTILLL